jgi:hypothetical protein
MDPQFLAVQTISSSASFEAELACDGGRRFGLLFGPLIRHLRSSDLQSLRGQRSFKLPDFPRDCPSVRDWVNQTERVSPLLARYFSQLPD